MIGGILTSDTRNQRLWKELERQEVLTKEQSKEMQRRAKHEDRHVVDVIFEDVTIPGDHAMEVLANFFQTEPIFLRDKVISPYVLNLLPKEVAEKHSIVVFKKIKDVIHVATTAPDNAQTIEFIKKKTGLEPKIFLTTPADITHALKKYNQELSTEFGRIIEDSLEDLHASKDSAETLAQHVPIMAMVDAIMEKAASQGASDVHIEPTKNQIVIRFRVDGLLAKMVDLPIELLPPLVTRLKIMSNLKIDEHRLPQDGRFSIAYSGRDVAVRVAIIPTLHGSKVVLRLLDAKEKQFTLRGLGFSAADLGLVKREMVKPHGMILVAGPTGSGKTTTLYTLLRMLHKEEVNICTIEDPIEYGIDGINQTQINTIAGLTFANGLRSLLRQDPDVIMVGEIRDSDTADIAVNAAMTGHLVLTTLHTNNAFLVPQRLVEMGIQPFLAASVINLIIAQRLVRKVCPDCAVRAPFSQKMYDQYNALFRLDETYAIIKASRQFVLPESILATKVLAARGCPKCHGSGYRGRIGIYEVMAMTPTLHTTILKNPNEDSVRDQALREGVHNMLTDGLMKVLEGQTTMAEVLRVTK